MDNPAGFTKAACEDVLKNSDSLEKAVAILNTSNCCLNEQPFHPSSSQKSEKKTPSLSAEKRFLFFRILRRKRRDIVLRRKMRKRSRS